MQTRRKVVLAALSKINVTTPSDADYALVDGSVEPVVRDLVERTVFAFPSYAEFDDSASIWLSLILAVEAASHFSMNTISGYENMSVADVRRYAERMLRAIAAPTTTFERIRAENF